MITAILTVLFWGVIVIGYVVLVFIFTVLLKTIWVDFREAAADPRPWGGQRHVAGPLEPDIDFCSKCGDRFFPAFPAPMSGYRIRYLPGAEELIFTCKRCGYTWSRPCVDDQHDRELTATKDVNTELEG